MTTLKLASGASIEIDDLLYSFVRDEAVPNSGKSVDEVFNILGELVEQFGPKNLELLDKRTTRQAKIDEYYLAKRKAGWAPTADSASNDAVELGKFLVDEGYLEPESPIEVRMTTPQLDLEMSQNGPELVTPVNIASMAVGGANARWGSLYDAYFLSDIHSEIDRDSRAQELANLETDPVPRSYQSELRVGIYVFHQTYWETNSSLRDKP